MRISIRTASRLSLLAALLFLVLLTLRSGRAGYAALLTRDAATTDNLAVATTAVTLVPGDADAQLLLGALFEVNNNRPAAIARYRIATTLRPADYVLWIQLARAQELEGENAAAIITAQKAVSLAPYYAQPRWQLGNVLVRSGQREMGFHELSVATASDPTLLPSVIDLAWQISAGDVGSVRQAIEPKTPVQYLALGNYFKQRGKLADAMAMFLGAEQTGGAKEAASARKQYLAELITAKKFHDAYKVWSLAEGVDSTGGITDPGFEKSIRLDESGFGWRLSGAEKSLAFSLDNSELKEGHSSLKVTFNGNSGTNIPLISQLVTLEPKTHYELRVGFRTRNLISGGLPVLLITDASNNEVLGQTDALPQVTGGWANTSLDFNTEESTNAIQIVLQRKPCGAQRCPIFGELWLDDFVLEPRRGH